MRFPMTGTTRLSSRRCWLGRTAGRILPQHLALRLSAVLVVRGNHLGHVLNGDDSRATPGFPTENADWHHRRCRVDSSFTCLPLSPGEFRFPHVLGDDGNAQLDRGWWHRLAVGRAHPRRL
jgi:hypothetical protein